MKDQATNYTGRVIRRRAHNDCTIEQAMQRVGVPVEYQQEVGALVYLARKHNVRCFQTGRHYSEHGQRIFYKHVPDGVAFYDYDRSIDGFVVYTGTEYPEHAVLRAYDTNVYHGTTDESVELRKLVDSVLANAPEPTTTESAPVVDEPINPVRIDHYTNSEQVVVFVCGHAVVERGFSVARAIAKPLGQTEIEVTVYGQGAPKVKHITV